MRIKTKEVLYLSYTGMTDPLGQSQVLSYLEQLSLDHQYKFTIISFEKKEAYRDKGEMIAQFCKLAGIEWYPLSYSARPPVISTFRDVLRMKKLAVQLVKKRQYKLVHCRSYVPSLAGLFLKKKWGIPFLFDMRGFWADERIDGGIWKKSNPLFNVIYRYFKKKEKQFLQNADHIVSLTVNAKEEMENWRLAFPLAPITVIPCCADFDIFNPATISNEQKNNALQELNIPSSALVFSYLGTLGTWYMISEMMAFAKVFQQSNPESYFIIITSESETMIKQVARQVGYDDRFLRIKKASRHEVPVYLSLSTFSIFFIKPAFSKKASSPVKQGELMAMGIPIVCNDKVGDTAAIIKACNGGVVIENFDNHHYRQAVETLTQQQFDGNYIRKSAEKYFLLSAGVGLYSQVYKQISR